MCFEMLRNIFFWKKSEIFLNMIIINWRENNVTGVVFRWLIEHPAVLAFDNEGKSVT